LTLPGSVRSSKGHIAVKWPRVHRAGPERAVGPPLSATMEHDEQR